MKRFAANQDAALELTDHEALAIFRWSADDDFRESMLAPDRAFSSVAAAERRWRSLRRVCWAREHRGRVPAPAVRFDRLVPPNEHYLGAVDLSACLSAIAEFERRDPTGAAEISDYLQQLREDLPVLHEAHLASVAHAQGRGDFMTPPFLRWGRYGDSP